jgi:DNA-binding NarL/FixJ family response regulator
VLVGRDVETHQLKRFIDRVGGGRGEALALVGEPGAGKTALLGHVIDRADEMVVLRARGIQAESEISFSGLLELVRPILTYLPEIPEPQVAALSGALALGPPSGGDRFAVYAATLSLLARAAQERPVLAVLDDVHWFDSASAEAMRFAARRLGEERVGMLFALRPDEFDTSGLPVLPVGGLDRDAALKLLPDSVAPDVAAQLLAATSGNPLALVEIPSLLSARQLEGREPLDDPLRLGARAERAFRTRLDGLARETRTALLVAAANTTPAVDTIVQALATLGLDADALDPAESAGLISIRGSALEFRHPLVRSTVYHAATAAERRVAHRALASVLEGVGGEHAAVRRAWHLAAAALGPDEAVAKQLDAAARAAAQRTGYAAAAIAFERAAELTPEGGGRLRRSVRAADAWQQAGRTGRAIELLDRSLPQIGDPILRATGFHLRYRIDIWRGLATEAKDRLVTEADRVHALAPELAANMRFDAVTGAIIAGPMSEALRIGRHAYERAHTLGGAHEVLAAAQLGKALILNGDNTGDPLVLRCVELLEREDLMTLATELAYCAPALMTIEAYDTTRLVLDRLVELARGAGAFGLLVYCLGALAELDTRTGRWDPAYAGAFEAVDRAREQEQLGMLSYNLARLAWVEGTRGSIEASRAHAEEAVDLADAHNVGSARFFADCALGLLELGLGDAEAAADRLERVDGTDRFGLKEPNRLTHWPDLIEAAVRTGRTTLAEQSLATFEAETSHARRRLSVALVHRARGLLAGDDGFEAEFTAALAAHAHTPFELARTQLCFGERLRRARRRAEARTQLRAALSTFESLGARPWAERARGELRASGARAPERDGGERLTAQELQVAHIIARGASNREAAAALFVSPKTIDSHLSSAYRKLGIRSRTELARHVLSADAPAAGGAVGVLTAQEHEVARVVASGAGNRAAAASLALSEKTVESHLSSVYRKLGIRSRTELGRRLAELDEGR